MYALEAHYHRAALPAGAWWPRIPGKDDLHEYYMGARAVRLYTYITNRYCESLGISMTISQTVHDSRYSSQLPSVMQFTLH